MSRDKRILVDSATGRIRFTLEPHQTLVVQDFSITEGYVAPVNVTIDPETNAVEVVQTLAENVVKGVSRDGNNAVNSATKEANEDNEGIVRSIFKRFVKERSIINPADYD